MLFISKKIPQKWGIFCGDGMRTPRNDETPLSLPLTGEKLIFLNCYN